MDIRAPEHQQGKGSLAESRKAIVKGGGGKPSVSPVLKGDGTGGPALQVRLLEDVRRDDAGSGGHPCEVYKADNWESGMVSGRQDLVYTEFYNYSYILI